MKKVLFNGKVWALTLITIFISFWSYIIFSLVTPYELDSYRTINNPNYDSSLGSVYIEDCWKEGHPEFGDYVCDQFDVNSQYIVDPQGRQNELWLFLYHFILIFGIYTYVVNNKESI